SFKRANLPWPVWKARPLQLLTGTTTEIFWTVICHSMWTLTAHSVTACLGTAHFSLIPTTGHPSTFSRSLPSGVLGGCLWAPRNFSSAVRTTHFLIPGTRPFSSPVRTTHFLTPATTPFSSPATRSPTKRPRHPLRSRVYQRALTLTRPRFIWR